jgi:hypothetical protein
MHGDVRRLFAPPRCRLWGFCRKQSDRLPAIHGIATARAFVLTGEYPQCRLATRIDLSVGQRQLQTNPRTADMVRRIARRRCDDANATSTKRWRGSSAAQKNRDAHENGKHNSHYHNPDATVRRRRLLPGARSWPLLRHGRIWVESLSKATQLRPSILRHFLVRLPRE